MLCHALDGKSVENIHFSPTQNIASIGSYIDTPGNYVESSYFYNNLSVCAQQAKVVLLLIAANGKTNPYPKCFVNLFIRPVIGVVTKTDLEDASSQDAVKFLKAAGVRGKIFTVSAVTGKGISFLRQASRVILGNKQQAV
jgi:ethanolamine utilization protein EutP